MGKPFLFQCPTLRMLVQGYSEFTDPPPDKSSRYEGIVCPACGGIHIVNPETGKLLSEKTED